MCHAYIGGMPLFVFIKLIFEFPVLLDEFPDSFLHVFPELIKRSLQIVNDLLIPWCLGKKFNHLINIMYS